MFIISLLDLIGLSGVLVALIILAAKARHKLERPLAFVMFLLLGLTAFLNLASFLEWQRLTISADPAENIEDYLQVLLPCLWGLFFYLCVEASHRNKLVSSRRQLRLLVENMPIMLQAYDNQYRIVAWNRESERVTGYQLEQLHGEHDVLDQLYPNQQFRKTIREECAQGGGDYQYRVTPIHTAQGEQRQVAWYNISKSFPINGWTNWSVGLDVTDQLRAEAELREMATHDRLTGLANRAVFEEQLQQTLAQVKRSHGKGAVIFIDLDHFKWINDSLGHSMGDKLLCQFAQRLRACLKPSDSIARFGGDEFVILLRDIPNSGIAGLVAERALNQVANTPFIINEHSVSVSASAGISVFPEDHDEAEELIKQADMALYASKNYGRNTFTFFARDMRKRLVLQQKISAGIRESLASNNGFQLHYQPQVSTSSNKLIGAEALIRWPGAPNHGMSPSTFIPIAEQVGLIIPLSKWVIETACIHASAWQLMSNGSVPLAVNLSARQFYQSKFADYLVSILKQQGLDPEAIELEITESTVMHDMQESLSIMHQLADRGFRLSIDDFGTGYSSLSYLKHFPVQKLKIDKSFIDHVEWDAKDAAIVRGVTQLGHNLGMKVLAEGVETEGQYKFLCDEGCDYIQGYYFAKPAPLETLLERY